MSIKDKWNQFNDWYNDAHPLIQMLIAAPIGGGIGALIGLFIWYKILNN